MSPAATFTPTEASTAALKVADALFYTRGITSVTMSDIRDESRVSMRRLYSLFPSKSDLVSAWLEHRHVRWIAAFAGRIDSGREAGLTPVDAVFSALEIWMIDTDFRGCGFIYTLGEVSELTEEHVAIIRHHKHGVATYLDSIVADGRAIALLVDGAIVQAAIFRSTEPIHVACRAAKALDPKGSDK